jgi:signal transduction histidine kinase
MSAVNSKTSEQLREYSEQLEARVRERTEEFVTLQRRFVDNVEAERLRVSQELHDGAMQEIYGLMFKLSMLFETSDNPEMQPEVASVIDDLKKINKSLRIVARELRPASLTPFGLEKAMRDYSERISLEHPEFHLSLDLMADGKRLPEHIRLTLFRIYQTALTNVIRHAHAQNVSVHFSFDEERAILKVQDDGKGFKVPERLRTLASQGHLGLAGAAERAEAIGGKLALESSPGKGTQLRVIAPLRTEVERQVSS